MENGDQSNQDIVPQAPTQDVRACLESLTGPSRGHVAWLIPDDLCVRVEADRLLRISPHDTGAARARLRWSGETYEIEALSDADIWVNRRKINTAHLLHGDMIEFGEDGPMSRFRLCGPKFPTHWPVDEILSDAWAYAQSSRRPMPSRLSNAFAHSLRRLMLETTLVFRVSVILVLAVLTTFVAWQYQSNIRLQESLRQEAMRLEVVSTTLAETRQDALTASELEQMRQQLDLQVTSNAERLSALEHRSGASARVIGTATSSVVFLQGAYGLRHVESGNFLRHVLSAEGVPLKSPFGKPLVDPEGEGAPLEFQFTGTGFVLKDKGLLVTNRHVAQPWTVGDKMSAFEQSGLMPEMLKLVAFLPGLQMPVDASLAAVSETADLALLSVPAFAAEGRGLVLAQEPPEIGVEVIVIGFPTGLRALLAQSGKDFLKALENTGETDFWTIATRLSEQNRIAPLASRGIIAQITQKAVIYDADTTVGGSGGPALNTNGEVIAVNAAILPEFGGANIGVPVAELHALLSRSVTD